MGGLPGLCFTSDESQQENDDRNSEQGMNDAAGVAKTLSELR